MKKLNLTPTKGSGSGPLEKEDGYNDILICQLKSTDAQSISVKQHDLHTLVYNSLVSHKTPVFAIQFLNTGEVWLMAKPDDFHLVCKGLEEGKRGIPDSIIRKRGTQREFTEEELDFLVKEVASGVTSAPEARKKFFDQQKKDCGGKWKGK